VGDGNAAHRLGTGRGNRSRRNNGKNGETREKHGTHGVISFRVLPDGFADPAVGLDKTDLTDPASHSLWTSQHQARMNRIADQRSVMDPGTEIAPAYNSTPDTS
jgi:hypothetical protein